MFQQEIQRYGYHRRHLPEAPLEATDSMPARMNYYLRVEKYRSDWNDFVTKTKAKATLNSVDAQTEFENEWSNYNNHSSKFKIPPLATYCDDGSYDLTNVAPGNYKIYYTTTGSSYPLWGNLFEAVIFYP
jgi:hypothetical protein